MVHLARGLLASAALAASACSVSRDVEVIPFIPPATTLFNGGDPGNDGTGLTVDATVFVFNDITVFASAGNVGFSMFDSSDPNEVIGHLEADSCLMSLSFLDPDDSQYINCIGTFDLDTGIMQGGCDSSSLVDVMGSIIDDCDLVDVFGITASVS